MKEQLKQFAIAARLSYVMTPDKPYIEDDLSEFAELVARRCMSIVSLYRRDNMQDKAIADTLEMCYQEIKLTFGIK